MLLPGVRTQCETTSTVVSSIRGSMAFNGKVHVQAVLHDLRVPRDGFLSLFAVKAALFLSPVFIDSVKGFNCAVLQCCYCLFFVIILLLLRKDPLKVGRGIERGSYRAKAEAGSPFAAPRQTISRTAIYNTALEGLAF